MDYVLLAAQLTAGHPVTGAFNADNHLAEDEFYAVNRPVTAGADALRLYFWLEKYRIDSGEPSLTSIYGRLVEVANAAVGATLFVAATTPKTATMKGIHACRALLAVVDAPNSSLSLLFDDARLNTLLVDAQAMGAFGSADKTAIVALGDNQQSLVTELGLLGLNHGHIAQVRG